MEVDEALERFEDDAAAFFDEIRAAVFDAARFAGAAFFADDLPPRAGAFFEEVAIFDDAAAFFDDAPAFFDDAERLVAAEVVPRFADDDALRFADDVLRFADDE